MRIWKKWFTLAELVVIMAVPLMLWTAGGVSMWNSSSDSRNTKRVSDLSQVSCAITTENAQGTPLRSFVVENNNSKISKISLAGYNAQVLDDYIYSVGSPNYTALWVKSDDFLDPSWKEYVLAITTKRGGKYEVSASMENGNWNLSPKVVWTYYSRDNKEYSYDNITDVDYENNLIVITDMTANYFKKWDFITNGRSFTQVKKVSNDGLTLTVDSVEGFSSSDVLNIVYSESEWLIDAYDTFVSGKVVVDWWDDLPYYY